MKYLVELKGNGCPDPDELEVVIKAALGAITEYQVLDIKVERVYTSEKSNRVPMEDEYGHGYD